MNVTFETNELMKKIFSVGDLRALCFAMGYSLEDVTSNYNTRDLAIMDIIGYCQRHGRFNDLLDAIGKARPNIIFELNHIRKHVGLQAMQEESPSETAVNKPNLVQEMRQHALAILSLCEQLEQAGSK